MTAPIGGFGGPGQGIGPRRIGLDIAGEGGLSKLMQQQADGPSFADTLKRALGEDSRVVYLQADICRQDLLVEIEAAGMQPLAAAA